MLKNVICGVGLLALVAAPSVASAGWVVEWKNTPLRKDVAQDSQKATVYIGANKSRMEQEHVITIYDYDKATFTVMNPETKLFWSGPLVEYVKISSKRRNEALRKTMGGKKRDEAGALTEPDAESLPEITITRSGEQRQIAGYDTVKYVIQVNEELFQELWIAEGLNVSADVDLGKFVEYQRKNSLGMTGNSAKPYNALYRSPAYMDMLKKGFALETKTHHLAGGFEQTAKSIRQTEIDASRFAVPEEYRRVQLADVFQIERE